MRRQALGSGGTVRRAVALTCSAGRLSPQGIRRQCHCTACMRTAGPTLARTVTVRRETVGSAAESSAELEGTPPLAPSSLTESQQQRARSATRMQPRLR